MSASSRGSPGSRSRDRLPDLAREVLDPRLEGRGLKLLLAAEQAEEAALAHRELVGEPPDRQPLEAVDRCAAHRDVQHLGARVGDGGGGATGHVDHDTVRTIVR